MGSVKKFLVLSFAILISLWSLGQNDTTTIIILHTNDMHAKIDRYPKIAYLIDSIRGLYKNTFLVSAGDLFTGNPVVDKYPQPGEPMIILMNKIGYNLSCIGNHEFDVGQKNLNLAFKEAKFPFICANINTRNSQLIQPKPFYKLKTKNGVTIGFLGLIELEKDGYPASNPNKLTGLKFYDPIKTVAKYRSYKDSANVFILLSHLGVKTDMKVAKKYPGLFDAIIGGHSHTLLRNGIWVGNTLVTQAGSYLRYLGILTLKVYKGHLVYKSDTVISIKTTKNYDKKIAELVKKFDNTPQFNVVIGQTKHDIVGKQNLGALITDAMRDTLHCDIAFQNAGGIRVHKLPAGPITIKEIYEMQPFSDTLYVYKLNVKQIKKLIRYAYDLYGRNELLVSGINVELYVDKDKNLKKIKLFDYKGHEIKKGIFTVGINDYMASAYVLPFLKEKHIDTHVVDAAATMNFIKKISPIVDYQNKHRVKTILLR